MFNKKLGIFLLALGMFGLAACEQPQQPAQSEGEPEKTSEVGPAVTSQGGEGDQSQGEEEAKVPTEEGKITFFFEYVDIQGGIALADLPEYVSPFITGWFNNWATTIDGGVKEMVRYGETAYFYTMIDEGADLQDFGYQIVLGYNAKSELPANKQGIAVWNFKTAYSDENFPGTEHPCMTKIADNLYEARSEEGKAAMGFTAVPSEPVQLKDISVTLTLDPAIDLGDALELVVKGDFNGWATQSVPNVQGKYILPICEGEETIIAGEFNFCFGLRNKIVGGDLDDKYILAKDWSNEDHVGEAAGGREAQDGEVYRISNIVLTMNALYGDGYEYDIGWLVLPQHANGSAAAYEYPSAVIPNLDGDLVIRVVDSAETPVQLEENVEMCIAGDLPTIGWGEPHHAMDKVEGENEYFVTIAAEELFVGSVYQFKMTKGAWDGWEIANGNDNFSLTLEAGKTEVIISADLTAWGGETAAKLLGTMEYAAPDMDCDVTIMVADINAADMSEKHAYIAGTMNDWGHTEMALELNVFTYTLDTEGMKVGATVMFKITGGNWGISEYGIGEECDNIVFQLEAGKNLLTVTADLTNLGDSAKHAVENVVYETLVAD